MPPHNGLTRLTVIISTALLLIACGGGGGSGSDEADSTTSTGLIEYAETTNARMPVIYASSETGEVFAPIIENDEIAGALLTNGDGESVHVESDEDGYPYRVSWDDWVIVFGNIRPNEGLADAVVINPDGEIERLNDINYDFDPNQARGELAGRIGWLEVKAAAPIVAVFINAGVCGAAIVASASTFLSTAVPALIIGCSGITAIALSSGDVEEQPEAVRDVATTAGLVSTASSTQGCFVPTGAANTIASCLDLIATIIVETSDNTVTQVEIEYLEQAIAVLQAQGGALQINLVWDNDSDLDLHVTDPNNEKIYYDNPFSASGGQLDIDDTDGYGPENIYWTLAPHGYYTIDVKHYATNLDGTSPRFVVRVMKDGVEKHVHRSNPIPVGETFPVLGFSYP